MNWKTKVALDLLLNNKVMGYGNSDKGYTYQDFYQLNSEPKDIMNIPYAAHSFLETAVFMLKKANMLIGGTEEIQWKVKLALDMRISCENYSSGGGQEVGIVYCKKVRSKEQMIMTIPYDAEKYIEHAWKLIVNSDNLISGRKLV